MFNIAMKVSVVMPVYNAADTLARALDSLAEQTIPVEVVVVNDGSTNGTLELLRTRKNIRLLNHSHRGIVPALNDGLAAASGEYIARMDADDVCHPARMELQAAYLDRFDEIGLVGSRVGFGGDRLAQKGYASYVDWINALILPDEIERSQFIESPFAHPSVMFRRGLFEQYGAYRDGPFPEDYDLWLRWMANRVRMSKLPEILLTWNDPPDRLSRTDARYHADAFYQLKSEYLAAWLRDHNPHHPDIVVWGGGRVTRRRAEMLLPFGIRISRYIDFKARVLPCGTPVISHEDLPGPDRCFVVPMVGTRGAREQIGHFLHERGFRNGINYIHCA